MKSILFNNACVITARFLVSLDFLFPSLFAPEKESQGSLLFLALFCFQGAVFVVLIRRLNYYITIFSFCQLKLSCLFIEIFVQIVLEDPKSRHKQRSYEG